MDRWEVEPLQAEQQNQKEGGGAVNLPQKPSFGRGFTDEGRGGKKEPP